MRKSNPDIDRVFKALADPTRREIFHLLVVAGLAMSISDITERFNISRQGVTKHIKVLEEAKMLNLKEAGRETLCEANLKSLKTVKEWIAFYDKFWDEKLKSLGDFLNQK